jgi:polar amino acid transport system permease protein
MDLRWEILAGYWPLFVSGVWMTIQLTLVAVAPAWRWACARAHQHLGDAPPPPSLPARALLAWPALGDGGLRHLLSRHAAVRADPAGALCADAGTHPSRPRLLLAGETARTFRQEHGAFFSGCLALSAQCRRLHQRDLPRRHPEHPPRPDPGRLQRGADPRAGHALRGAAAGFRRMVPALVNEGVTLIKDSSLVSAIGLAELALAARTVAGAYSRYWEPYLAISAIYLVLTLTLSLLAKRLEAPAHLRGR